METKLEINHQLISKKEAIFDENLKLDVNSTDDTKINHELNNNIGKSTLNRCQDTPEMKENRKTKHGLLDRLGDLRHQIRWIHSEIVSAY